VSLTETAADSGVFIGAATTFVNAAAGPLLNDMIHIVPGSTITVTLPGPSPLA